MKCTWRRPAKRLWQLTREFISSYQAKYPKATECLEKDKEWLFSFYDFPAQHWPHLRTTNPIESTFATVRLRTHRTKGCGSRIGVLGESRPKGMLANNSLVCITSELPVIRAQSDGMPPLAVSRFGGIVLSQCAAARVSLDMRRHKYERQ